MKPRISTVDRAVLILEYRPRSCEQLVRRALLKKGEPADAIEQSIERLVSAGALDDAQFARQFARSKAVSSGFSRQRIQRELSRRGVARELTDEAIAAVFADEVIDEPDTIDRLVRKKLGQRSLRDQATFRRVLTHSWSGASYDAWSAIRAGLGPCALRRGSCIPGVRSAKFEQERLSLLTRSTLDRSAHENAHWGLVDCPGSGLRRW